MMEVKAQRDTLSNHANLLSNESVAFAPRLGWLPQKRSSAWPQIKAIEDAPSSSSEEEDVSPVCQAPDATRKQAHSSCRWRQGQEAQEVVFQFGLEESLKCGCRKQPKQKARQNLDWWGDRRLNRHMERGQHIRSNISKTTAKKPIWGEMAVRLPDLSFPSRTGEQIKTKVHDLSAAYKDIVDLVKPSGAGTKVLEEFRSRDRSSRGISFFLQNVECNEKEALCSSSSFIKKERKSKMHNLLISILMIYTLK